MKRHCASIHPWPMANRLGYRVSIGMDKEGEKDERRSIEDRVKLGNQCTHT